MAREHRSTYILSAEDRTRQAFASLEKNFRQTERLLGTLRNLTVGAFSIAGLTAFVNKMAEIERQQNRLTATINAQGHAAGFTRRQLDDMADALAAASEFDDDAFTSAQAELLKFGNIYEDVFERALKLSADLASFQGTDLLTATQTVAKALQSPATSLKAFEQVLGKIDPVQKRVIENFLAQNKGVEAQNKLLDILQGKIGGTAALMNTGYLGSIKNVTEKWDDFLESLGKSPAIATGVVTSLNAITSALKFLDNAVKGPADSEIQAKLVLRLQRDLTNLKAQRGSRFGAYPEDILPGFLDPAETERRIAAAEAAVKNAQFDLDRMRQIELEQLFGATQTAKKPPPVVLNPGGLLKGKGGGIGEVNRNLLGIAGDFFAQAQLAASFGAVDLERSREIVERANELTRMKADGEAFATEQLRLYRDAQRGATASMEVYIKSIENETRLMGTTTGGRQRLLDIMRLEEEQRELNSKGAGFAADEYQRLIAKLNAARDAQDLLNQSWAFGSNNALAQYLETVDNVATSTERLVTDAFKGMEDALLRFVQTGKLSFRSLAESIIADLIRIQIQQAITGPLAGFIAGLIPGVSAGGAIEVSGLAHGGPMSAWRPYLVGEEGPELVIPRASGTVIPNSALGGDVIIYQTNNIDSRSDQASIALAMWQSKEMAKAELKREFARRPMSRP